MNKAGGGDKSLRQILDKLDMLPVDVRVRDGYRTVEVPSDVFDQAVEFIRSAVSHVGTRTKAQCLAAVVEELNLDTSDPFTRILAAAFALQDAYDESRAASNHPVPKERDSDKEAMLNFVEAVGDLLSVPKQPRDGYSARVIEAVRSASSATATTTELESQRDNLAMLVRSMTHALRSYEHGNGSPDLAKSIADRAMNYLCSKGLQGSPLRESGVTTDGKTKDSQ